ncbi:MAG: NAD(+)/NADH kinase [Bacteroidales bacterium]|jgi:NAD+ kinase|nr:NAD(+)/NADH kinase [Bacteroidales bacterium]
MKQLNIGIFGTSVKPGHIPDYGRLIGWLNEHNITVRFYKPFALLCREQGLVDSNVPTFSNPNDLAETCNLLISLGGDGTLLNAASFVVGSEIPIVGLNFGKLGFLAPIDMHFLEDALADLCAGNYDVEHRSMLAIRAKDSDGTHLALNDVAFKSDTTGLLSMDVFINGQFLNTYFGDGLMVSTPTGSTAYNLSCGGPILLPENQNFILTPIASHTLTVRPLVIPDTVGIEIRVTDSEQRFHATLDSRRLNFEGQQTFFIEKAPSQIHTIRFKNQHFFDTLRSKLMWGQHARVI